VKLQFSPGHSHLKVADMPTYMPIPYTAVLIFVAAISFLLSRSKMKIPAFISLLFILAYGLLGI
jgi:hypothetical protein